MDYSTMRLFLSEENIKMHLEYLNKQRLVYSILQKSNPQIVGDNIKDIFNKNLFQKDKFDAINLLCDIKSHEIFFNSFASSVPVCKRIKKYYGSVEKLIYDVYVLAKNNSTGFVYLCMDKKGNPRIEYRREPSDIFIKYEPVLALDLCEHAYFKDYGFNKDRYLKNSLGYFDLKLLDDRLISLDN